MGPPLNPAQKKVDNNSNKVDNKTIKVDKDLIKLIKAENNLTKR